MRPIDRMLASVRRDAGEELLLETGKPIRVRQGTSLRVILAQDVRGDQVVGLLRDAAPPDVVAGLHQDGEATFAYDAPTGPFVVEVKRSGAVVDAVLAPKGGGGAAKRAIGVVQLQQKVVAAPRPPPPPVLEDSGKLGVLKNLVDRVLVTAAALGATDVHLPAGLPPRMRVDDALAPIPGFAEALGGDTIRSWLLEPAPEAARARFEKHAECVYAHDLAGVGRFRVQVFKDRRGTSGAVRRAPLRPLDAEQIGLPGVVRDLAALQRGLVLVTGPAGSGRTTTLHALVDVVNQTRADHVVVIEDPAEIVHEPKLALITQLEARTYGDDRGAALEAAARSDADVIVVGELRDPPSILRALELAEGGALVFAAMSLPTATAAIERVLDVVPLERQQLARVMLADALRGVVAQTTCRKAGGGRVAAFEVLLGLPQIANAIREGKTFQIPALVAAGKQYGLRTLNDALVELVAQHVVGAEEAYERAVDKAAIQPLLERVLQQRSS